MAVSDAPAAVRLHQLTRRFGEFTAVNGISLEVGAGEIFGFLGPNGAGKSTAIRMICGIIEPTSGTGTVAGFDLVKEAEKIKSHIGYMSQKFSLYEDLTVEENINFYSGIYRLPAAKKTERKEWVIEMAGLTGHRSVRTGTLSTGWKQRLALGCAILHEPKIVFLDEPTSGVDPVSRRNFWSLIYDLAGKGVTIFVTTHYMDEAEYCDRLGLIYRGDIIALDTPSELKKRFMQGEVVELSCGEPHKVLDLIDQLPEVLNASLFGTDIHIAVSRAADVVPVLKALCAAHGIAVRRMERIEPSLEDVFVSLIQEKDRQEGRQKAVNR